MAFFLSLLPANFYCRADLASLIYNNLMFDVKGTQKRQSICTFTCSQLSLNDLIKTVGKFHLESPAVYTLGLFENFCKCKNKICFNRRN